MHKLNYSNYGLFHGRPSKMVEAESYRQSGTGAIVLKLILFRCS
jgi:hypothetical protein